MTLKLLWGYQSMGCRPCFGNPRCIIWMGTWRMLHPIRILHALGAFSVHVGVLLGEPRIRTQSWVLFPTGQPRSIYLKEWLHFLSITFIVFNCSILYCNHNRKMLYYSEVLFFQLREKIYLQGVYLKSPLWKSNYQFVNLNNLSVKALAI